MKFSVTVQVTGVRAERDVKIVTDGGTFYVRKGEWLMYGSGYGPMTVPEEELGIEFVRLDFPEDEDEGRLRRALETGSF